MSESTTTPISALLCFSGAHIGTAGAVVNFLANGGADATALVLTNAQGFPAPAGSHSLRNLRARCPANALAAVLNATVYKNGVATTLTVAITAGSTALFSDVTHVIAFAAGDQMDLRLDSTAGGALNVATVVATVEVL